MLGTAFESLGSPIFYYGELIGLTSWTPDLGIVLRRHPIFGLRLLRAVRAQRKNWKPYAFEAGRLDLQKLLGTFSSTSGLHVAKVFWDHLSDDTLARALEELRPTVIFLRRNHYDRLVSHLLAIQNNAWHGRTYADSNVEISEGLLRQYADDYFDWYRRTRLLCDELGLRTLDIAYEDLIVPGALQEIIATVCGDRIPRVRVQNALPATQRQATGSTPTTEGLQLRERYTFPALEKFGPS